MTIQQWPRILDKRPIRVCQEVVIRIAFCEAMDQKEVPFDRTRQCDLSGAAKLIAGGNARSSCGNR